MSEKKVIVCDGCGKILERTSEIYHLKLETDRFWDGVENVKFIENLDFCKKCAVHIKQVLENCPNLLNKKIDTLIEAIVKRIHERYIAPYDRHPSGRLPTAVKVALEIKDIIKNTKDLVMKS